MWVSAPRNSCGRWEPLCIRAQVDLTACFHQLTALAGAEAGIPKKALPQEEKVSLRIFFDIL